MITIIKDYFFKHNVIGSINYFNNAKDLLRQPSYDVYFLDILIRDMNGIELGKILKQKNEKCEIIYRCDYFTNNAKKKVPVFGLTGMVK